MIDTTDRAFYIETKKKSVSRETKSTTQNLMLKFLSHRNTSGMHMMYTYAWRKLLELFSKSCRPGESRRERSKRLSESGTDDERGDHQVILRKKSIQDVSRRRKLRKRIVADPDHLVQPVGTDDISIVEMCAIIDFVMDMMDNKPEHFPDSNSIYLPNGLNQILQDMISSCQVLGAAELNATLELATKIVSRIQPFSSSAVSASDGKKLETSRSLSRENSGEVSSLLQRIGEEEAESESIQTQDSDPTESNSIVSSSIRGDAESLFQSQQHLVPLDSPSSEAASSPAVLTVKCVESLFSTFITSRLVTNPDLMKRLFESLLTGHNSNMMSTALDENRFTAEKTDIQKTLKIDHDMISVYKNLCHLLLKSSLFPKSEKKVTSPSTDSGIISSSDLRSYQLKEDEDSSLPNWLRDMLLLCSRCSSIPVTYHSLSTFLKLVSIQRSHQLNLPVPKSASSPSNSSPVLEFQDDSRPSATELDPLVSAKHLRYIYASTNFYTTVTELLWDKLSDEYSQLHLETAILLQQIHNLVEELPVCESVICTSMASSDEAESYEARKKFCTLFNITRDLKLSDQTTHGIARREFDRPLFFMLDSLTHKLDIHNAQAIDWLNQCLKNGDIARILEPLLFILLHPDTSRVSVQHVNVHQPCDVDSVSSARHDESDAAAQAMEEAKIYAISCTGGNTMYHINPEARKRFNSSPIATQKVYSLTTQDNQSRNSSFVTRSYKDVTPVDTPQSVLPVNSRMHMRLNPFGSMSSLGSEALDPSELDTPQTCHPPTDFSNIRRPVKLITKGTFFDINKRNSTPSPATPRTTPVPDRSIQRMETEESDESESDSDIIGHLMDEMVDNVIESVDGFDSVEKERDEDTSSSSSATTTHQTMSEPISMSNWLKPVAVNQLHSHILLYTQVYDSRRTLYALTTLWNIILTDPSKVLFSMATTSISNRLGFRSQELQTICARHKKALFGKGFFCELDSDSVSSYRSSTFLEVIVTTCLYYIRSYYPGLPQPKLTEDEIIGNQKVRVLSSEILRLIFNELIPTIRGKHAFTSYLYDMLMRCKVQKYVLHSVVSCVYNLQVKSSTDAANRKGSEDIFTDNIVEFNEKIGISSGFQEDLQKSLLKLLEQLMVLEHKTGPQTGNEKDLPTHNRKGSDPKASRIRFQPQMSSLKYCPSVAIPSQAMFLSAIQAALQESHTTHLHSNWLSLVEATLPYAGRSLTRLVVCVVSQLCHTLDSLSLTIQKQEPGLQMPPNHVIHILKSLGTLCHYCLCDNNMQTSSPPLSPHPQPTTTISSSASSGGTSLVSLVNPIQTLSNFLHVFSSEAISEPTPNRDSTADPLVSTRRTLLSHLPRILAALHNLWKSVATTGLNTGWEVMGSVKDVKLTILDLLSPISLLHGTHFMGAVAVNWHDLREGPPPTAELTARTSVIPVPSQNQLVLVDLVAAIRVLPMDIVLQTVKQVMKQPPQTTQGRKKRLPLEVCILQFFLSYIRVFPGTQLLECWKSLLSLLKEGIQVSAGQPLAQFNLLAILYEFVQAAPLIEDRKDQKDLQDLAQKLVDACTTVAGARLGQTRWLRRNLEVKPGPQQDSHHDEDTDGEMNDNTLQMDASSSNFDADSDNIFLAKFSVQALNALAEFVAPVLDVVYVSEEKEKVVPLVSNIIYYVTPYLRNHSKQNAPSFKACSHLLSSISGYQYSRKAWRKDAFELLLDPTFFQMEASCLPDWKIVVDHLMTHDKTTFRDFLARMSVNQGGAALKLFANKDQENELRAQLAKRLAFIIFCSEKDQYQRYMPDIQGL